VATHGNKEQTVLLVSNDAGFCAAIRRKFAINTLSVRAASVSNVAAARRVLEQDAPGVILLEEDAVTAESEGARGLAPSLESVVAPLAIRAPVIVIGPPEKRDELAGLINAHAVDYIAREGACLETAFRAVQRRLQQAQQESAGIPEIFESEEEDFGEVLRHELNNPLTGILGNAELLLAEIHRKNDGRIPHGGEQRLETIASLAVRLRETVRRLSQQWEERRHPVP